METDYAGIDYSLGAANIDTGTGIRFGVMPQCEILQSWVDSSEPEYGDPHCPKCGHAAIAGEAHAEQRENGVTVWTEHPEHCGEWECDGCGDYRCDGCEYLFDADQAFGDDPQSFRLDDGEYLATQSGDDCDIFVLRSPYYTHAQFCSPCAPGAAYLMNPCDSGPQAYCFGHDWFDSGRAPYPVFRVSDNTIVEPAC